MEDYPRTIQEFEERFSTEKGCRAYLVSLRWPDGFRCPQCQGAKAVLVRATLFQCCGCRRQTSATAGTIFQDTRKPLVMWFRAMWYVTSQKNGASALAPFFWLVTYHIARNHITSGFRVSWKIVPAVAEVWRRQPQHWNKVARTKTALAPLHCGQRTPSGHRRLTRYARHPSSVEKRSSNSWTVRG